ncbi:MAG: ABC transporter substrate-binding protein [Planctomycetota bacterium]
MGEQFLDPRDVRFSWALYANPGVDCDEKRFMFEKMTDCRIVDDRRVRFFYQEQYAFSLEQIGTSLTLMPSHIYDLSDPDNPAYDPKATAADQAEHINKNPHNKLWVGLGPYRVTQWTQQYVQAERFADAQGRTLYFDRANAGYFDVIRWRYIDDDEVAMNALENGELDFFDRVKSTDYFGERTSREAFKKSFYKGYRYLGMYGFTGWNLYRPQLKDKAVRDAIAHAFDFKEYLRTNYSGLARQTTGPVPYGSEGYPTDLEPYPYSPDRAIELLEEAGWYDRDGDDIADKDGVKLSIEFLYPSGNDASKTFGTKLQESLKSIGIELRLTTLEWATFLERLKSRDFDGCNLAWIPPLESDPEQLWHSRLGARDVRSSNNSGVQDPKVDAMIAGIQAETDTAKRMKLWQEFHRYIYLEVQPYLFMYNVPYKFAVTREFRGLQSFAIDPGYSLRRWYYWNPERPGLRKTLDP